MKLSKRERLFVVLAILSIVFYFYWIWFLDPLIVETDKIRIENNLMKQKLAQSKLISFESGSNDNTLKSIDLPTKDQQTDRILSFIDIEFRSSPMKILSLSQNVIEDAIIFDLKFEGSYENIKNFINKLTKSQLYISLTDVLLEENYGKIFAAIKIAAPYK